MCKGCGWACLGTRRWTGGVGMEYGVFKEGGGEMANILHG